MGRVECVRVGPYARRRDRNDALAALGRSEWLAIAALAISGVSAFLAFRADRRAGRAEERAVRADRRD
jgi:hypothetical protein